MSPTRSLAASAVLLLVALASAAPVLGQDQPPGPPSATPNPVALDAPAGDGTAVRLTTDLGDIVIGLFNQSAPVAAQNFQNLAASGFYDGVGFHRVVPGFVVQGGDPDGTGAGGPGYTIPDEEVVGEYGRGIVAMARTQAPDSQGSQFFFVLDDDARAALDSARTYVIFGRVVEGMDVVDAIVAQGPASDQIEDPVRIQSATIEQVELPPEPTPAPPTAGERAAEALLAQLPADVAGVELVDRVSFSSEQIVGQVPQEQLADLVAVAEAHGTDLAALALARAGGSSGDSDAAIVVGSVPGVPADETLMPMARLVLGLPAEAASTEESVAGRTVTRFDLESGQTAYAIPNGEVVWLVLADPASLEALVSSLPSKS